jgi:hypothetical protein
MDMDTPCSATGWRSRTWRRMRRGWPPSTMKFSEITSTKSTGTRVSRKSR